MRFPPCSLNTQSVALSIKERSATMDTSPIAAIGTAITKSFQKGVFFRLKGKVSRAATKKTYATRKTHWIMSRMAKFDLRRIAPGLLYTGRFTRLKCSPGARGPLCRKYNSGVEYSFSILRCPPLGAGPAFRTEDYFNRLA